MTDDRTLLEELAALDAAGALDGAEQRELRSRLALASVEERASIARLYNLAATTAVDTALSAKTPAPPAGLRDRLMTRIEHSHLYSLLAADGVWKPAPIPGIRIKLLSLDRARDAATILMRVEPGTRYPPHHHTGAEECYVISGDVVAGGRHLYAGDFHHAEANSDHGELYSETGCELLLVVGAADYM